MIMEGDLVRLSKGRIRFLRKNSPKFRVLNCIMKVTKIDFSTSSRTGKMRAYAMLDKDYMMPKLVSSGFSPIGSGEYVNLNFLVLHRKRKKKTPRSILHGFLVSMSERIKRKKH
jgi:hypothetical protein